MARKFYITPAEERVERYLGFGGRVERKGRMFWVASSPEEHVTWQTGRLASGWLCSGETWDTQREAEKAAESLGENWGENE